MENKKFKILQDNYELLFAMIELAEKRNPVQGKFCFSGWNDFDDYATEKECVLNCGTSGCLAGGYLPLLDKERFYFDSTGGFYDEFKVFVCGRLYQELGSELFDALFVPMKQERIGLEDLYGASTLKEVIENAKKVLALCEIEN